MIYLRKEKILDVTDCDFTDLEHMEKSIAGSIASKFGFSYLKMTEEQIAWYKDITKKDKFKDKDILEGKREKK